MTSFATRMVWLRARCHDSGWRPGSVFERRAWPAFVAPPDPTSTTLRLSNLAEQAAGSAGSLHYRLRPILRDIAAPRLASFHGVDLDADPLRARRLLGDALFDLLRADRPVPDDPRSPGLPLDELAAHLDRLENL